MVARQSQPKPDREHRGEAAAGAGEFHGKSSFLSFLSTAPVPPLRGVASGAADILTRLSCAAAQCCPRSDSAGCPTHRRTAKMCGFIPSTSCAASPFVKGVKDGPGGRRRSRTGKRRVMAIPGRVRARPCGGGAYPLRHGALSLPFAGSHRRAKARTPLGGRGRSRTGRRRVLAIPRRDRARPYKARAAERRRLFFTRAPLDPRRCSSLTQSCQGLC